jgi:hypothetical protein
MDARRTLFTLIAIAAPLAGELVLSAPATAVGIIQIPEASFTPAAGLITFSEFPVGTVNPVYPPAAYGGDPATAPTVTFEGFFSGQHLGAAAPPCPAGAALTGCVLGPTDSFTNPFANNPLTLDPAAPNTFITNDGANPTSPVLSGSPQFNGPIGILFSSDQVGVGLNGGFFNALNSTAITAIDDTGAVLGQVTNSQLGIEFLGLITDDGLPHIRGLLFSLVGAEPAGFAIDNVRFGVQGQVIPPGTVPEPTTLSLLGAALAGLGFLHRQRRRYASRAI